MFSLMKDHQFSLSEMEELIPWERDVYVILLKEWIKEENQRQQKQQASMKTPSMPRRPSMPSVPRPR